MTDADYDFQDDEQRLCGQFWTWLYDERKRRGSEPSDAEKEAHPASVALKELRNPPPSRDDPSDE